MSNTNYPNLNPQLQNAKGAAINAKDAVVNSKVRGQSIPARALLAPVLYEVVSFVTHQSIAAAFSEGHLRLCSRSTYASSTQELPHIKFRLC